MTINSSREAVLCWK